MSTLMVLRLFCVALLSTASCNLFRDASEINALEGSYELEAVDDRPLPQSLASAPACVDSLVEGSLSLTGLVHRTSNLPYIFRLLAARTCPPAAPVVDNLSLNGGYWELQDRNRILFLPRNDGRPGSPAPPPPYSGTYTREPGRNTVTVVRDGRRYRFKSVTLVNP